MTDLLDVLRSKAEALQAQLLAKVEANLSGAVLQSHSGALKASILAEMVASGDSLTATVSSRGVSYAAIQERGGITRPHDIVPVKAQALAFAGVYARRVRHPGATIPARSYLGSALDALHGDIVLGLKEGVLASLAATPLEAA